MKTTVITPKENLIKITILAILFITLLLKSTFVDAQRQMGLEAQFGVQSFDISSDIEAINGMSVAQEGGSLGLVYGGNVFRTHLQFAGFYYSSASVKRTVDQFRAGFYTTFHPVELVTGHAVKVSPYTITGASYTDLRFFGHYLDAPEAKVNYSTGNEPYIGSVKKINARVGLGLEWNKRIESSFIQVYGEVVYGAPLDQSTNRTVLANTTSSSTMAVQVGVRAGIVKRKR